MNKSSGLSASKTERVSLQSIELIERSRARGLLRAEWYCFRKKREYKVRVLFFPLLCLHTLAVFSRKCRKKTIVSEKFYPITANQRNEIYRCVFRRAFARSAKSKQTLIAGRVRRNLRIYCSCQHNTFFPDRPHLRPYCCNARGLISLHVSLETINSSNESHRSRRCNQFKVCELQQRALSIYAAISGTFSISNRICNKVGIHSF